MKRKIFFFLLFEAFVYGKLLYNNPWVELYKTLLMFCVVPFIGISFFLLNEKDIWLEDEDQNYVEKGI